MKYVFPKDFEFGVATASYQIEGGWNEDGKGENIWDRFVHQPGHIHDNTVGDVACDFYHRYEEDIEIAKKFGIQVYRMSINWARIYPEGTGEINQKGIEYYRKVLQCLHDNGIKSSVTIYHWDLPQKLQDRGGWGNREIVGWFDAYARTLYKELGDLVDYWITLNEPYCTSIIGHWTGEHAPGWHDYSLALQAVHNLMLCHGTAVKAFRESGLKSEIGITLNLDRAYPATDCKEDVEAAERATMESIHLFCDPVFKGTFPQKLFDYLKGQGVVLPNVLPGDKDIMCQKLDFLGVNFYQTAFVKAKEGNWPLNLETVKTGRPITDADWQVTPEGIYNTLDYVNKEYKPEKIIITENGAACNDWVATDGRIKDTNRTEFLKMYLAEVHRAIAEGMPITGYYVWCFCDNFEWAWGLARRFGLVYVDYPTQKRIPKDSLYWYKELIESRAFEIK